MSGIRDFYRGDTKIYRLTFTDSSGLPISLVGGTVWFTMKTNTELADNAAILQVSTSVHIDAPNGITQITVPAAETDDLVPGTSYHYDFQFVDSNDNVTTVLAGRVKILADVTRST